MDFHRYCLVCGVGICIVLFGVSCEHFDSASTEPVVISNATLNFVTKVFKKFSKNGTESLTVDGFASLLETLKIGKVFDVSGHAETIHKHEQVVKSPDEGQHVHRRSVEQQPGGFVNLKPHFQRFHNTCLSKDRLLELHHINKNEKITKDEFIQLCPSLVYEVQSGNCWHNPKTETKLNVDNATFQVWGYGFASITVISLSSLLAIAVIPCLGKDVYKKIMSFLVALAVGTLAGDAFLHLIPHAFLRGVHTEEDHHGNEVNPLWKGVAIMSGIYIFFLIESFMKARLSKHPKHRDEDHLIKERCTTPPPHEPLVKADDMVNHNNCSPSECNEASRQIKGVTSPNGESAYGTDSTHSDSSIECDIGKLKAPVFFTSEQCLNAADIEKNGNLSEYSYDGCSTHCPDLPQSPRTEISIGETVSDKVAVIDEHHHSDHHHGHHHHGKSIDQNTSIATVAWMVIVGDGFHNLSDGLAVGAAFSSSAATGFTTAIAVLCHELPHELGDFAILIKSGISFRQAIAYNLASAFISYIGLVIGLGIGNLDTSHVWVLALTSGLFLYISLVSMLPELKSYQEGGGFSVFFTQNVGILTGIVIMLIIALFETH